MAERTYEVEVVEEEEGPDAAMRERLATVAAYRLGRLDARDGYYPSVGEPFDMLDNLDGPFFWERTEEQLADDPPTQVDFEVVAVDPAERPDAGVVRVTVRVPF